MPADPTGTLLGERYRLVAPLGTGGMATVYRAVDESLGREVAIKLFDANASDPGRQESELAVLAALDHHGLVTLYDAGVHREPGHRTTRYLVMALVRGLNLAERLHGAPIASRNIAEIGYDLAEALEYVHGRGVVHRDVKPSNILLVDYGNSAPRARARLTDFGVALADGTERFTSEGTTTGTAAYLSPEQASGAPVGPASDVYALGLVTLQCFTRRVEYDGTPVESALARLSRDPAVPDILPDHWRVLLRSMTARDPSARPSGRELVSAFRQIAIAESGRHSESRSTDDDVSRLGPRRPEVMDTIPNEALHRATAMAARILEAPISVVSIVDHDRTWLVSYYGDEVEDIVRQIDLSGARDPSPDVFIVEDASLDPRTKDSPLVAAPINLRFYVGIPLTRSDGRVFGTLSVAGFAPSAVNESQLQTLRDLAAIVTGQLEYREQALRTDSGPDPD